MHQHGVGSDCTDTPIYLRGGATASLVRNREEHATADLWGDTRPAERLSLLAEGARVLLDRIGTLEAERREDAARYEKKQRKALLDLLTVVDTFDEVATSLESLKAQVAPVQQRVFGRLRIVAKQLGRWLADQGVEGYEAQGEFDPTRHVIVDTEFDASKPPGVIIWQVKRGYCLHGDVLRAAHVVVSTDDENHPTSIETEKGA